MLRPGSRRHTAARRRSSDSAGPSSSAATMSSCPVRTGTGKTLTAFLPLLAKLPDPLPDGIVGLILTPLKALGQDQLGNVRQVVEALRTGCSHCPAGPATRRPADRRRGDADAAASALDDARKPGRDADAGVSFKPATLTSLAVGHRSTRSTPWPATSAAVTWPCHLNASRRSPAPIQAASSLVRDVRADHGGRPLPRRATIGRAGSSRCPDLTTFELAIEPLAADSRV